ncbi:S-adenosyl-L-methionine-dependent methyltransferase [Cadophora sp. MPI-SDFR-AT-0126]|nr:S-adenosyl-L-methionine-dependent methyltransferase [Leotiomycetes sp. MPI-SDFR-AT-0126]
MAPNNLVALAAAVREALAAPQTLIAESKEEKEARLDLIDMIPEFNAALVGNANVLRELAWSAVNVAPLHAINRWGLAKLVPLDSAVTYDELSEKTGVSKPVLQRLLRHAMTNRLFSEREGKISHTPTSRLLVDDVRLAAFVDLHTEGVWKTWPHFMDAYERWPDSRNPREVGYSLAWGRPGEVSLYEDVQKDPVRATNFGRAMELFSSGEGYGAESLVEGFPWADYGSGTVVDVGGGSGFASAAIAKAFPSLHFIVQDIVVNDALRVENPEANIEWMQYDFNTPQTVVADVYFYRFVFHNYPDATVINILKAATAALKKGAKVLINDSGLPDPGEARWFDEKAARSLDVLMLAAMNGRERSKDDWEALFKGADPRYKFNGATLPSGSRIFIIEAEWTG